jgi:hypothetical protein
MLVICLYGCATDKFALTKPINGYITFKGVEIVAEDDNVSIELTYRCHGANGIASYLIVNEIAGQLNDIAAKNDMYLPSTSQTDSIGKTLITTHYYEKIDKFFKNLMHRFRQFPTNGKKYPMPVFNISLTHGTLTNNAIFNCSRSLFEPDALISFKSEDGGLRSEPDLDSPNLTVHTSTANLIEYIVHPASQDPLLSGSIDTFKLVYNRPPAPWYTWRGMKRIFSSENDTTENKTDEIQETKSSGTGLSLKGFFTRLISGLNWFAATAIPILGFLGYNRYKRRKKSS